MQFEVTPEQKSKILSWMNELFADKWPYYGAIGGGLTYHFTPTTVGLVLKVTEASTGKELDLTDCESW